MRAAVIRASAEPVNSGRSNHYRLKRIQKGKPLKKTQQTDAIFANIQAVRDEVRDDPETLEISMDTKAKVPLGDYVRGGKNPDRCRR
jgi:Rhodopirellula transposase DDE domain